MTYSGRIARLNRSGVGFIADIEQPAPREDYVFSFDKIRRRVNSTYVPYRGESVRSLGFREGASVMFEEENGQVQSVELR